MSGRRLFSARGRLDVEHPRFDRGAFAVAPTRVVRCATNSCVSHTILSSSSQQDVLTFKKHKLHSYVDSDPTTIFCPGEGCGCTFVVGMCQCQLCAALTLLGFCSTALFAAWMLVGRWSAVMAIAHVCCAAKSPTRPPLAMKCVRAWCACRVQICLTVMPCVQVQQWKDHELRLLDASTYQFMMTNFKRCPSCKAFVERNRGCTWQRSNLNGVRHELTPED